MLRLHIASRHLPCQPPAAYAPAVSAPVEEFGYQSPMLRHRETSSRQDSKAMIRRPLFARATHLSFFQSRHRARPPLFAASQRAWLFHTQCRHKGITAAEDMQRGSSERWQAQRGQRAETSFMVTAAFDAFCLAASFHMSAFHLLLPAV